MPKIGLNLREKDISSFSDRDFSGISKNNNYFTHTADEAPHFSDFKCL
jgi:hypothetical protein